MFGFYDPMTMSYSYYNDPYRYYNRPYSEAEMAQFRREEAAKKQRMLNETKAEREAWMQEIGIIFKNIYATHFAVAPHAKSPDELLLRSIEKLERDLIIELHREADASAIKCAKQLQKTLAITFDDKKSPLQQRIAIHHFQCTARNSIFSNNTKETIGVVAAAIGALLLLAGVASLACVPALGIPLAIAGLTAIGTGLVFMIAGGAAIVSHNTYDDRGKVTTDHLKTLIKSRQYGHSKHTDERHETSSSLLSRVAFGK